MTVRPTLASRALDLSIIGAQAQTAPTANPFAITPLTTRHRPAKNFVGYAAQQTLTGITLGAEPLTEPTDSPIGRNKGEK